MFIAIEIFDAILFQYSPFLAYMPRSRKFTGNTATGRTTAASGRMRTVAAFQPSRAFSAILTIR